MDILRLCFYDQCFFLSSYDFNSSFIFVENLISSWCEYGGLISYFSWDFLFYHIVLGDFISSCNIEWFYFIIYMMWMGRALTFLWRLQGPCSVKGWFPFSASKWKSSSRLSYPRIHHPLFVVASYLEWVMTNAASLASFFGPSIFVSCDVLILGNTCRKPNDYYCSIYFKGITLDNIFQSRSKHVYIRYRWIYNVLGARLFVLS